MYIYRCEDSLESIFTAIYNVYEDGRKDDDVLLTLDDEPRLFAVENIVEPQVEKCEKVMRTLQRKFGVPNYRSLCMTLASPDAEKAQAVYVTVKQGIASKSIPGHLFDNLADIYVNKAFSLARNADREYCHLRGFVRFEEMEGGLMYAQIEPRNNVLVFLMEHFADRFPEENFVLHDVRRNLYGLHSVQETTKREMSWCLVQGADLEEKERNLSSDEIKYRELFKGFCQAIAIEARRNTRLQQNMLPLHFREFMTEFK